MPQPPSPVLLVQDPAINLQQLIGNITVPVLLTNLITTYEGFLNTGSKYQTASVLSTMPERMKALVTAQAQTNGMHAQCILLVKALADESLKTFASAKAILAVVNAADTGTDISMYTQKLVIDFEAVNNRIREMLQHFMDDVFEESGTYLQSYSDKFSELDRLLADDPQQESWVLKSMQQAVAELTGYASKLSLDTAQQACVAAYQLLLPFYAEAVGWYGLIAKKRAVNPLLSDSLFTSSGAFVQATEALTQQFNNCINTLYQYDQELEPLRQQINCIGIVAAKVQGAT